MKKYHAIVVGASAGGISTFKKILRQIPKDFRLSILAVQHIHASLPSDFALAFQSESQLPVKEAEDKETINSGTVYLAPPGYHLLVEADKTLSLSVDDRVNFSRPSIDLLFETAAEAFNTQLIGIILTGANSDGAKGAKVIKDSGGLVIVEDPETAYCPTMPLAALKECKPDYILSADAIGRLLLQLENANTDEVSVESN